MFVSGSVATASVLLAVSIGGQATLPGLPGIDAGPNHAPSRGSGPWAAPDPTEPGSDASSYASASLDLRAVLEAAPTPRVAQSEAQPDDATKLAMQLANPLATLISVPIQTNVDKGIGPADADRTTINVQPVIPFALNDDWNLISRTIVPFIDAESPVSTGSDESGVGDILESLFFSPSRPTASGWLWGAGPVFSLPTASNEALGSEKWGVGPTAVALKQQNGWTYGGLMNHVWSFAGDDDGTDINRTFLQPFLSFTSKTHTTVGLNTESSYDWDSEDWTVPINVTAGQLLKVGKLPVSVTVGYRYYAEAPAGGPDWGLRLVMTLLFPK